MLTTYSNFNYVHPNCSEALKFKMDKESWISDFDTYFKLTEIDKCLMARNLRVIIPREGFEQVQNAR